MHIHFRAEAKLSCATEPQQPKQQQKLTLIEFAQFFFLPLPFILFHTEQYLQRLFVFVSFFLLLGLLGT